MASRRRHRSEPSAAAEAESDHASSKADEQGAAKRHQGEGAGSASSAAHTGDVSYGHDELSVDRHEPEPAADEQVAATSGHGLHVPERPPGGARAPQLTYLHPATARHLLACVLTMSTLM